MAYKHFTFTPSKKIIVWLVYLQLECLINLLDDFHNIHGIKVPVKGKISKVAHTASSMIGIQRSVPVVKPPIATPVHRPTTIKQGAQTLTCPGGIDEDAITQIMGNAVTALKCHFLDCLPEQMLKLQPEKLQQYLRELRYILYIYKTLSGHILGQTSAASFTQTKNRTESPIPVINQLQYM